MKLRRHAVLILLFATAALNAGAQNDASLGAVLVTGAPSGIGRKITERLASRGFIVYAGARTPQEMEDLRQIKNVHPIRLDVTSPTDIAAAVGTVQQSGHSLRAIVNNAGVVGVTPLIEMSEKELSFVLDVNLFGPYRITKAFAPLLLASKGRVINISSLNGIVASPMIGAYSMSKHGIEAFSDGLSAELAPFGVKVSAIEPGNYGTSIGRNLLARVDTSQLSSSRFEQQWRSALGAMASFESGPPPDAVADAVYDAIASANPKRRYLVVPVANQATIVVRKLMDEIVQLNSRQPYTMDREALVRMLDEALAREKGT